MRIKLFGVTYIFVIGLHPDRKIKWLPNVIWGTVRRLK